MRRLIMLLAVMFVATCGDDDNRGGPDDDPDDPMPDDATFTSFVIDLVNNQTTEDASPAPLADFESLPDPDRDTNNEGAYSTLFE